MAWNGITVMNGKDFKKWRLKKGISRKEAAHLFKISQETIKSWEIGRRQIAIPYVLLLACRYVDLTWKR